MSRLISRDPFARTELHRASVGTGSCKWCGSHKRLDHYWTESDGGRKFAHPGLFCSVSCFRSYNS